MRRNLAGFGFALLLAPSLAFAGAEQAGTTAANFLVIGLGARILGMGGASLALPGGVGSLSWNPGSLGWVDATEVVLSHAGLAEGTSQEGVALGGRIGASETRWGLSGLYQTEGSFDALDASGLATGSFGVSSMAVGGHLAHRFGGIATVGLGAKWVSESLGASHGSGVTFDGGVQVRAGMLGFGVAAQNLGGQMKYDGLVYPFPRNIGAGVSLDHAKSGLRLDVDVNVPSAYYKNLRGGVEWQWRDRFALRGGYRAELGAPAEEALTGPAFGMGAGAHGMWLDYGYLITRSGEGQHRMGISILPGRMRWRPGDPFGQKEIRRDYDDERVGPPAPAAPAAKKKG